MVFFKKKDKEKEKDKDKDKDNKDKNKETSSGTSSLSNSLASLPTLSTSSSLPDISIPSRSSSPSPTPSPSPPETPKEGKEDKEKPEKIQFSPKSNEDVETTFLKLLHALGIPQDKHAEMMKWDTERKLHLIKQHKSKGKKLDPQSQVNILKNLADTSLMTPQEMRNQMAKVRQCVTSSLVGWVAKFISVGGFHALLDILRKSLIGRTPNPPVIAEAIMILKSMMNTPSGMKATVETPAMYKLVITAISLCGVSSEPAPTDVAVARQISQNGMDVLTAVGLIPPDGHRLVLEAANTLDRNPRFYWLLREMWAIIPLLSESPSSTGVLVSGMSLINVIVNSPDELRVRVVLRNELFALGLDGLLWALAEHQSKEEKLAKQLSTFTYLHEDDMYELENRFENIASDPVDLIRQLIRKLERTPVYTSLISVLHNLATVSGGKMTPSKVKCWRHIETSINRIVLHDIGTTMDVDVAHLSSILNKNEFGNTVPTPWAEYRENASFRDSDGGWMKVDVSTKGGRILDLPPSFSDPDISSPEKRNSEIRKSRISSTQLPNGLERSDTSSSFDESGNNDESGFFKPPMTMKNPRISQLTNENRTPSRPNSVSMPPPVPEEIAKSGETITPTGMTKSSSAPHVPPPPPPMGGKKNSLLHKALMGTTKPKSKTRQLQWKKVPDMKAASAPFWSKAAHLDLAADAAFVESMFVAKENRSVFSIGRKTFTDSERANFASGNDPEPRVSVLDPKREHNIEIMLSSRLKRHPRVISEAILTLNENLVDAEGVNQILKSLPTDEEIKKLQNLSIEDIPRLGKAEVFFFELLKVPRLQGKLECWRYMIAFESTIDDVIPALTSVQQASEQIMGSKKFTFLLHMILAFGNFLNTGGGQGNAMGFKLDGLTKLRDVKTTDNKGTLLHVLANVLENRHPEVLDFFQDMLAVEEARKVNGALLKAKVHALRSGFAAVNNELAHEAPNEQIFMDKVSAFLAVASPKIEEIDALSVSMDKAFTDLINYYGEDPATQPEEFFELLAKFATMLAAAHAENESRKRREAYQMKKSMRHIPQPTQDANKRTTQAREDAQAQAQPSTPAQGPVAAVEAGIDSLLQDIQNGGVEAIVARRPTLDTDIRPNIPSPQLSSRTSPSVPTTKVAKSIMTS